MQYKRTHWISLFLSTFSIIRSDLLFLSRSQERRTCHNYIAYSHDWPIISLSYWIFLRNCSIWAIETLALPCMLVSPFIWYQIYIFSYYASQFFFLVSREHKNFSRVENNRRRCNQTEQARGGKVESMIFVFHSAEIEKNRERERKREKERKRKSGMYYRCWSLFQPLSWSCEQTTVINFVLSVCQWDNTNPNKMI